MKHVCKVCSRSFENGFKLGGHPRVHNKSLESYKQDKGRRLYLIREFGHKCCICENPEWQSTPIPLELDHIDGNPANNVRENLRVICPNCHAQTDTYKGKNTGRKDIDFSERNQCTKI